MDFQLQVKAITDSDNIKKQLLDLENYYKSNPIKIQIDLGGTNGYKSGITSERIEIDSLTQSTQKYTTSVAGMRLAREKVLQSGDIAKTFKSESDAVDKTVVSTSNGVTQLNNYDSAQKRVISNAAGIETLKIKISGLTDAQKDLASVTERMVAIESETDPVKKSSQIKALSSDINAASRNMNTFAASVEYTVERFVQIGVVVGTFRVLKNAILDMVGVVTNLNTSIVELQKVTNLEGNSLQEFIQRAYDVGSTLARTGQDVIDATTVFSRAGYEIKDALDLANSALLLTNVADGINSVSDASSTLISVLKAFNMNANESLHIVDALNEVSNNYAIDTDNLADILQRVSGTLGQTGTTMEEVFGLAVGGFTTLRNAEMVASGLNMISQRMRGMKEDGEAIEGLVPKIEEALQKYTNGAVSMWDKQTGELRSTYDVLNDLAKVYPSLTSAQKAYLNEVIAGDNTALCVQKCA